MSGIRTRSSSVPTPEARRTSTGGIVTRAAGKSRIVPQVLGQANLHVNANIVAINDPDVPGVGNVPANVQPEDIVEEMGPIDSNLNESEINLPSIPTIIISTGPAGLPALNDLDATVPMPIGSNSRMYSDEDIRAIIQAARLDYCDPVQSNITC